MNDTMIPPKDRDTEPPDPRDALHRSTLPPFASEQRVTDLEDKHTEVMATLGEIRSLVGALADRVTAFHEELRHSDIDERINKLAGRLAAIDGKREGTNGNNAMG